MQKDPTPYAELNTVLKYLVDTLQDTLSTNFVGAYLQGSFAVGDFDLHSDVDFIVVIAEKLNEKQVQTLQAVHDHIYRLESPWAHHLEGSYFPQAVLRDSPRRGQTVWYLDHGSRTLIESDHCNTLVVRWVVREQGVSLAGPPPRTLVNPIPVEMLQREIIDVIRGWGEEIVADPTRYNNRFYQTYIVLNYCRMLHDLYRGCPGSKRAGAEWAKMNLPAWSDLIDRAWDGRLNPALSVRQPADPGDFERTLKFVNLIIAESAQYAPRRA